MVGERDKRLEDDTRLKTELYLAQKKVGWFEKKLTEKDELILKLKDQAHQSMTTSSNSPRYYEERNTSTSEKGEMQCIIDEMEARTNITDKRMKEMTTHLERLESYFKNQKWIQAPLESQDQSFNKKMESILRETLSRQDQLGQRIQNLEDFLRQQSSEDRITQVVNSSALNSRIEDVFKSRSEITEKRLMQSVRSTIQKQMGLYNQESLQTQNQTFERINLIVESLQRDVQKSAHASSDPMELCELHSQLQSLTILVSKQHELHSSIDSLAAGLKNMHSSIARDRESHNKSLQEIQNAQDLLLKHSRQKSAPPSSISSSPNHQSHQELKTMILEVEQRLLKRMEARASQRSPIEENVEKILGKISSMHHVSAVQPIHRNQPIPDDQISRTLQALNAKVDALIAQPSPNWKIRIDLQDYFRQHPFQSILLFFIMLCFLALFFRILCHKALSRRATV